ncbi:MAG: hypothetical protein JWM80_1865 [Cyanobacteria bacterium RYN_339]|nr:hypothetical protein [Cyanobacteria bacterium RYN_339]
MFKPFFIASLALALTACSHAAPVAQVASPSAIAAAANAEKAAKALITTTLIPPGESVRMSVTDIELKARKAGGYDFTCTRTQTTRWAEREYFAVKGTVTDVVTYTEHMVKSEPIR